VRLALHCPIWRIQIVVHTPPVVHLCTRQVDTMWAKARSVPRNLLQVLSASIGKRTLISVAAAISVLAAVVILVGTSVGNDPSEAELIDALPTAPAAGPSDVQPVHFALTTAPPVSDTDLTSAPRVSDAPLTSTPPLSDAENLVQSSGVPWELVPSPRPRPAHKSRQRRAHNMRNLASNEFALTSATPASNDRLASTPPASDTETLTPTSGSPGELVSSSRPPPVHKARRHVHNKRNLARNEVALRNAPPASDAALTSTPPASDAGTLVQASGAFWELVPSPRPRPVHKPPQRRMHNMRTLASNEVAVLPAPGVVEIQPLRPRLAFIELPRASDAETLVQSPGGYPGWDVQSSGAFAEVRALPPPPTTDPIEVQPVPQLAALSGQPPVGDTVAQAQGSGTTWELVPSPRPRPVHEPHAPKMRNLADRVHVNKPMTILKDLRDQSEIDRVVKDNPSNVVLLLMAEMRRESQETSRLVKKLFDEIEPPALAQEMNYASASRVQLEAYRLDLKTAEANATTVMPRYEAVLESEREKVEVVVQLLDMDDRSKRTALSEIDKQRAQRISVTSKMLLANAQLYRTIGAYVEILLEQFGRYQVSRNGHFVFSSESVPERYNDASRQINDAIKRIAELEEERKRLAEFQQQEWERFASGK
jgi:hypothetical protein